MSGEEIFVYLAQIFNTAFGFLRNTVLFTYGGKPVTLWTALVFICGLSIVVDMFIILSGGSPYDDECDMDSDD